MVEAFFSISTNRVLNKQVRDFIRNGEDTSALEALKADVTGGDVTIAGRLSHGDCGR